MHLQKLVISAERLATGGNLLRPCTAEVIKLWMQVLTQGDPTPALSISLTTPIAVYEISTVLNGPRPKPIEF